MLDHIFSRHHREPGAWDIPRTPTNEERVQRYRAVAPVALANTRRLPEPRRMIEPTGRMRRLMR